MIGLMSGTSADGTDAALVKLWGCPPEVEFSLLAHCEIPYSNEFRQRILTCCRPQTGRVDDLCALNFQLGEKFARAARQVAKMASLEMEDVDLIGSHGQTVHHLPPGKRTTPSTLQLGAAAVIAERTHTPVVHDFRSRDMAVGGHGAPLVPFVDWALFGDAKTAKAVQNIGGIANVTFLPPNATRREIVAFDTGPGNMLLDLAVSWLTEGAETFDEDGVRARRGTVSEEFLCDLMDHPFIETPPPKSTGREQFGRGFFERIKSWVWEQKRYGPLSRDDFVASLTAFTAEAIAQSYDLYLPEEEIEEVIIGGGGGFNTALVDMLRKRFGSGVSFKRHLDYGIPDESKEALAFAVLAYASVLGVPNNVPSATGAGRAVVLGSVTPPGRFSAAEDL